MDQKSTPFFEDLGRGEASTRPVGAAIMVNINIDDVDRSVGVCAIPAYEVGLLAARWRPTGGSLTILADWPGNMSRVRRLTHDAVMAEIVRLRTTYVIPQAQGKRDLFAEIFGTGRDIRFGKVMAQQYKAWRALERAGKPVTVEDLTKLVADAMPADIEALEIEMEDTISGDLAQGADPALVAKGTDPADDDALDGEGFDTDPTVIFQQYLLGKGVIGDTNADLCTLYGDGRLNARPLDIKVFDVVRGATTKARKGELLELVTAYTKG